MNTRTRLVMLLAMVCVLAAPLLGQPAQHTPEERLQSALYTQQIEGDLGGAIEMLRALVDEFPEHRAVAARALVQLGLAHETLGSGDAEGAYQRVVNDYPDQLAAADQARARLATLRPSPTTEADGLVTRRRWLTSGAELGEAGAWISHGAVSPDGHSIAFTDWAAIPEAGRTGQGELMVYDTRTGEYRVVVSHDAEARNDYVLWAIWSADGQRLAYSIWGSPDHEILHVVNADGSDDRVITDNQQHTQMQPGAWSARGDFIVAHVRGWDEAHRIAVVSVDDGSVRILKTLRRPFLYRGMSLSLSPDDRYIAYASAASGEAGGLFVLAVDGSGEERVASSAARDAYPLWTPDGDRLVFVSDRSGSAGLWAVEVVNGRAVTEPELIRPDVGPIVPLGFSEEGVLSYSHFQSNFDIRVADVDWERGDFVGEAAPLSDRFVGTNSSATWSPDGSRIAYLSRRAGAGMQGASYLVVKSFEDGAERDIELAMRLTRDSRPEWSADGRYVLLNGIHVDPTDSSSTLLAGYRIDVETGEVQRQRYIRDWVGHWRSQRARTASARQSEQLRSMGIRIIGQRDHRSYQSGDQPLRAGEQLLWVRNGIRWVRSFDCEGVPRPPRSECVPYPSSRLRDVEGDAHGSSPVTGAMVGWVVGEATFGGWELSPDATMVAYVKAPDPSSRPDALWVWPLTGGEPRQVARVGEGEWIPAVRWMPDGSHLLFATVEGSGRDFKQIVRVGVNGGQPQPIDLPLTR